MSPLDSSCTVVVSFPGSKHINHVSQLSELNSSNWIAEDLETEQTDLWTLPLHAVSWLWNMGCVFVCWEIWSYFHKMSLNLLQESSTSRRTTTGKTFSKLWVTSQALIFNLTNQIADYLIVSNWKLLKSCTVKWPVVHGINLRNTPFPLLIRLIPRLYPMYGKQKSTWVWGYLWACLLWRITVWFHLLSWKPIEGLRSKPLKHLLK